MAAATQASRASFQTARDSDGRLDADSRNRPLGRNVRVRAATEARRSRSEPSASRDRCICIRMQLDLHPRARVSLERSPLEPTDPIRSERRLAPPPLRCYLAFE